MQYPDLTLMTCSFNTPRHVQAMLQSFVSIHGDGPFNCLICENSTDDETRKLLDENGIKYLLNPGGTHSVSVDKLLDACPTQYALLVDSDIVYIKKIDRLLEVMKSNNAAILGEIQADRGGYRLYPRIAPWFCLINTYHIKENKIKFHDQSRIDKTNSKYFYQSIPLNPHVNNSAPFYDVGATFYEDISNSGLKILNAKGVEKYFIHYEGGSWRRSSGHAGYVNLGNSVYEKFMADTKYLSNVSIERKFNSSPQPQRSGMITRERYLELFEKWKPQQIKEEFWQFINFMNQREPVKRFLEIGTAFGTTIPFFSEMASDLAITVDIRPLQYERLTDPKVKYIVGDSAHPAIISQIKQHLNGELFDFIFIDGAHEYPAVKRDYQIYREFVKKGGILAFHDVVILQEVKKFWDELTPTLQEKFQVFYLTDGTGNGIGVIHM